MTHDEPSLRTVHVTMSADSRDLLVEALGMFADRYRSHGEQFRMRCAAIVKLLEHAPTAAATSVLDSDERTLVRRALATHAYDTRGWYGGAPDEERSAVTALDARLCLDEAEYDFARALDDEPPTQRMRPTARPVADRAVQQCQNAP
jgi:hypothetical protein